MERVGFPLSDKLKSPGASNALAAYLLYELAKPIRYPVTVVGTIYAVRLLRRLGHLKPPPRTETVSNIVQAQGKMVHQRLKTHASKYRDRYGVSRHSSKHGKLNGHKSGRGKHK